MLAVFFYFLHKKSWIPTGFITKVLALLHSDPRLHEHRSTWGWLTRKNDLGLLLCFALEVSCLEKRLPHDEREPLTLRNLPSLLINQWGQEHGRVQHRQDSNLALHQQCPKSAEVDARGWHVHTHNFCLALPMATGVDTRRHPGPDSCPSALSHFTNIGRLGS